MAKKNDLIEVTITETNNLGSGVGRTHGQVHFVVGACEGDTVLARVMKVTKSYLVSKIESILTPSVHRITPDCPIAGKCGGCVYRHVTMEHEKALKEQSVKTLLQQAGVDAKVLPLLTPVSDRYRNKVQYPTQNGRAGYYRQNSHTIVPLDDCLLQPQIFSGITTKVMDFVNKYGISCYNEETHTGLLRHVYLRTNQKQDEILLTLVVREENLPQKQLFVQEMTAAFPQIKGILLSVNAKEGNVILGDRFVTLWGKDSITDTLLGCTFAISAPSFYQINHDATEVLYKVASDLASIEEGDRVADLFCGIGTIGICLCKGKKVASLVGIEIIPEAVENAKENARQNGMENAEFYCGDANHPALSGADVILVDPPRKGLEEELIQTIAKLNPRKVVYISCNPATFARDLRLFQDLGYKAGDVQPVNLFPRTAHTETVVLLSREKADDYIRISVNAKDLQMRTN